jgi:hypothetical protein
MNVFLQRKSEWSYQTTKYENGIDVSENDFMGAHLQNHVKYCSNILLKPLNVNT